MGGTGPGTVPIPGLAIPGLAIPGLFVPGLAIPGLFVPGLAIPGAAFLGTIPCFFIYPVTCPGTSARTSLAR